MSKLFISLTAFYCLLSNIFVPTLALNKKYNMGYFHNCITAWGDSESVKCWGQGGESLGYGDTDNRGDESG